MVTPSVCWNVCVKHWIEYLSVYCYDSNLMIAIIILYLYLFLFFQKCIYHSYSILRIKSQLHVQYNPLVGCVCVIIICFLNQ